MKKIMFLVLMMAISVIGASQTIGDSYDDYISSSNNYEKGVDNKGEGYLLLSDSKMVMKFYFNEGYCDNVMIISRHKDITDDIITAMFQLLHKN